VNGSNLCVLLLDLVARRSSWWQLQQELACTSTPRPDTRTTTPAPATSTATSLRKLALRPPPPRFSPPRTSPLPFSPPRRRLSTHSLRDWIIHSTGTARLSSPRPANTHRWCAPDRDMGAQSEAQRHAQGTLLRALRRSAVVGAAARVVPLLRRRVLRALRAGTVCVTWRGVAWRHSTH
jgi:hypothetical protein